MAQQARTALLERETPTLVHASLAKITVAQETLASLDRQETALGDTTIWASRAQLRQMLA